MGRLRITGTSGPRNRRSLMRRVRFRYLEGDEDADNYQGHSHARVYVEETAPRVPIFILMATLRNGTNVRCEFRATGNPHGPGHQWVRARCIDPAPRGSQLLEESFVDKQRPKACWRGGLEGATETKIEETRQPARRHPPASVSGQSRGAVRVSSARRSAPTAGASLAG